LVIPRTFPPKFKKEEWPWVPFFPVNWEFKFPLKNFKKIKGEPKYENRPKKCLFQLGNATVKIHHKTMMESLNDILTIGNSYRLAKGLRALKLEEYLYRESTWELIEATENRIYGDNLNPENLRIIDFDKYRRTNGQIDCPKLMKNFSV